MARDPEASLVHEVAGHAFVVFGGLINRLGDAVTNWFNNELPGVSVENDNAPQGSSPFG